MPATPATTPEPPKSKRRISEEGMKRIVAATKKRWRLAKAAKAQTATAKEAVSARTNVAANKTVMKAVPARPAKKRGTAKKAAAKKATAKKMAMVPAETATQSASQ